MSAPAAVHKDDLHAALRALPTRAEMRAGFAQLRGEMRAGFSEMHGEMNAGFAEMRAGFAQLRDDHKAIRRRLFGALVVLLGLLANNLLA